MQDLWLILAPITTLAALCIGYVSSAYVQKIKANTAVSSAERILKDARQEADVTLREAHIHAKDELIRLRDEFERSTKERRNEIAALETRTADRERNLDRKLSMLDKKEDALDQKLENLEGVRAKLEAQEAEAAALNEQQQLRLQAVAEMSRDQARQVLMENLEEEVRGESGALIRHRQEEAKETAERDARKILTLAIERYAADQVNEITTSAVHLESDEIKGRIIGKEGRNIRAFEAETGVNVLIDDTPETVLISGFDPLRREIARQSLERLIADGRIHPARIEEVVAKVKEELNETIRVAGETAILELGLRGVPPEILRTLGRLKFRQSYSQNVLSHSVEMAHLMATMASELNLDPGMARRIGLFHDIGKALDHDVEGGHAIIGAELLKKHGEDPIVVNAVAAHHGDVEKESLYAVLTSAADAVTAARPGARSDTTDIYIKRLKQLEEIAGSFRGVVKCYAIQAGRELRVIVEPHKIDDNEAMQMARNISKQIEEQVNYPGQIKITVVRETRCIEYAK